MSVRDPETSMRKYYHLTATVPTENSSIELVLQITILE